ncbi:MAG: 4-hydroxythreonine-4-phosphate dehydrogenase PdxA, partial [Flavobacteriaceae bacterium]
NHESFKEAVYLAIDIFKKRNDYQELIKNPLKTKEKQL